ncbi:hypothetical protein RW64_16870 [Geobacter sulfurreducens]|nr:hypothetical protein RW64_16870 [Geobacter sulfurreducens]
MNMLAWALCYLVLATPIPSAPNPSQGDLDRARKVLEVMVQPSTMSIGTVLIKVDSNLDGRFDAFLKLTDVAGGCKDGYISSSDQSSRRWVVREGQLVVEAGEARDCYLLADGWRALDTVLNDISGGIIEAVTSAAGANYSVLPPRKDLVFREYWGYRP